ncbi:TPA: hypothetical protein QDA94_003366 [Burkholderia vietnamiensis]|nr:hypothetical protein [Burkholderia vietnamiensis]HDR9232147.1 hypothetical protein [Burkholderia vietnamiensis]
MDQTHGKSYGRKSELYAKRRGFSQHEQRVSRSAAFGGRIVRIAVRFVFDRLSFHPALAAFAQAGRSGRNRPARDEVARRRRTACSEPPVGFDMQRRHPAPDAPIRRRYRHSSGASTGSIIVAVIAAHMPTNSPNALPGRHPHDPPHAADSVQPPAIGVPPIASIEACSASVAHSAAANAAASAAQNARSALRGATECRPDRVARRIARLRAQSRAYSS